MKVIIKNAKREYDGYFKVDKVVLQHEKFDGSMSSEIDRLNFNRGDTVAVILYNKTNKSVVLIRQFRYPAYVDDGPGWLIECVAGIKDNDNVTVAKKEVLEETGYEIDDVGLLTQFYPSPGGCSERIFIYLAYVGVKDKTKEKYFGIGNEDIQVLEIPLTKAFEMVKSGEICDGKTIIGLFHLREKLEKE
ncbi:NTP pyrophosphohydrolases including oxidative damage repair enzymes [Candidatus Scalindua japonica]|uniref:GDP-mannose pyrophosphatase n=1 Tax=Candidatus Scalindua japonica TaxID=1284222 RepID=A0A286U0Q7_9BACT|nr:NUDIX hydrolase [Candidatus Scalindua japonica]GAX61740.1 NTP pyrophosphohydrolases including oxidative damage repair enzymes [Candidatus Scalindua japonica]